MLHTVSFFSPGHQMTQTGVQAVSVVIPAWNAANFIPRAIASALTAQDGHAQGNAVQVTEVIVIDDHSSDDTLAVVQRLAETEPRLKLLQTPQNLGPGGSRNAGIKAATGDWIAVLDADDAYAPGRLPRLVDTALRNDFSIIADLPVLYDLAAKSSAPTQLPASGRLVQLGLADLLRPDPDTGLDLGLLKPVFHRRLVAEDLWHYPEAVRHGEDFALYFDLVKRGEAFGLLHEAHYIFSTRIGEISGSYSPGSVTNVDYRAIAAQAEELARQMAEQPGASPEVLALLQARAIRALRQNRIHGWTLLRKRQGRRLKNWLLSTPANRRDMMQMVLAKLTGHRGLPD